MHVFKFTPKAFAAEVADGVVRISPTHVFRMDDVHGDGRSDPDELTSAAQPKDGGEIIRSDHPAFPADMFVFIKGGKRYHTDMTVSGAEVRVYDNALLYCTSTILTEDVRRAMLDKFNAGAVFKIEDIDDFAARVSASPSLENFNLRKGLVEYADPAATTLAEMQPVSPFRKRLMYQWQSEYRLVWEGQASSAFNVMVPSVSTLLTRLPDTRSV